MDPHILEWPPKYWGSLQNGGGPKKSFLLAELAKIGPPTFKSVATPLVPIYSRVYTYIDSVVPNLFMPRDKYSVAPNIFMPRAKYFHLCQAFEGQLINKCKGQCILYSIKQILSAKNEKYKFIRYFAITIFAFANFGIKITYCFLAMFWLFFYCSSFVAGHLFTATGQSLAHGPLVYGHGPVFGPRATC